MARTLTRKQIAAGFGGKRRRTSRRTTARRPGSRRAAKPIIKLGRAAPALLVGYRAAMAARANLGAGPVQAAGAAVDEVADNLIGMPAGITRKEAWNPSKPLTLLGTYIGGRVASKAASKVGINRALRKLTGRKGVQV